MEKTEQIDNTPATPGYGEVGLYSVCIATYKRPDLLGKLLSSLEAQTLPASISIEIVVVDNDSEPTAQAEVTSFRHGSHHKVLYFHQPTRNISLTRNMAVKNASGAFLLFIDDDEIASVNWIRNLIETQHEYKADGVFGPVRPIFNSGTPQWMRRADLFYTVVPATGSHARYTWTSNCLISADILKRTIGPFDPRYGLSDGEDVHLFSRLERLGATFIYCQEAWVSEYLPPNRTSLSYIFIRALKGGNTHTRRAIEFAGRKHLTMRIFLALKGLGYGTVSMAITALFFLTPVRRTLWSNKLASNIGRFLGACGWYYQRS